MLVEVHTMTHADEYYFIEPLYFQKKLHLKWASLIQWHKILEPTLGRRKSVASETQKQFTTIS